LHDVATCISEPEDRDDPAGTGFRSGLFDEPVSDELSEDAFEVKPGWNEMFTVTMVSHPGVVAEGDVFEDGKYYLFSGCHDVLRGSLLLYYMYLEFAGVTLHEGGGPIEMGDVRLRVPS
jgi:hypothetical protein